MSAGGEARRGVRLLEVAALVVGYGLAATLLRAFWPREEPVPLAIAGVAALALAWLGLAMAGPLVLLVERRGHGDLGGGYTWAELAWLLIGGYWIGLAMLVVPDRMRVHPLLLPLPVVAALLLRVIGPRREATPAGRSAREAWTHRVAVGLIVSWPLAWAALVLLGKALF